jgi:hypothetical protein
VVNHTKVNGWARVFLHRSAGDDRHMLWLAILTPSAAAAALVCLFYALTGSHR